MVGNYHWAIYGAIVALIGVAQGPSSLEQYAADSDLNVCRLAPELRSRRGTPRSGSVLSHQDGFARGWGLAGESISARGYRSKLPATNLVRLPHGWGNAGEGGTPEIAGGELGSRA